MKKILFILPFPPYPLSSGGNQAVFNMIDYVRRKLAVSVLLYVTSDEQAKDVEELKKIWDNITFFILNKAVAKPEVKHPSYYRFLEKLHSSVVRKMKRQLVSEEKKDIAHKKSLLYTTNSRPLDTAYIEYVAEISRLGFDIIQVEFLGLASLGYLLPEDVQTVFVHHELLFVRNENEMALWDRVTDEERLMFHMAKDFERGVLRSFRHVIALTETDRQALVRFMGREEGVYASPAVVQMADDTGREVMPTASRLTFVGSESHYPNLDAVTWFCREVAPCLRRRKLRFVFHVIGNWQSSYVKKLQDSCPEMELAGFVEDLHSYLNGSIMLVPVRIGSGMRMKILDAVSSKAPFVTTTKGVEGLDLRHGEECLIADSAEDFADAVIRLTADGKMQAKLANGAAERLRRLYKPQEMLDRRLDIYSSMLGTNLRLL